MKSIRVFYVLLIFSWSAHSFPQEQQTEVPTSASDDIEEESLRDMMDNYTEVPYIEGELSCQCGIPASNRIVGGENANINDYPWTAVIYVVESDTLRIPYCGGALINNLYILTAAHCVDGMKEGGVEVVLREQNLSTVAPAGMMMGRSGLLPIRMGVERFIKHPHYSRITLDNDIALVKLNMRVPLVDFPLASICVPTEEALFSQGLYATVAGYGAKSEYEKHAANLQMAEVRVLSNELCNTAQFHKGKITPNMLCADGNGKGPCAGDTGGPLMIRSSKDSAKKVLAGIASWSTTCEDSTLPAVYTRVSRYESWIREITRDAKYCKI